MSLARVEIAFGVAPFNSTSLDVATNWVDVSASCRSVKYKTSSASDRFSVFSAGSATVVLDDRDREFDPSYASSTYVGDFKRSTPVRVIGTHTLGAATYDETGGASEDLWTLSAHGMDDGQRVQFSAVGTGASGYAADTDYYVVGSTANAFQLSATLGGAAIAGTGDSAGTWTLGRLDTQWYGYAKKWTPGYQGLDAVTTLTAHDGLGLLARYDLDEIAAAHSGDTVAARIGRILDEVGFPSSYRDLDPGTSLTSTTFGVNALRHCQLAARSDGGWFYAQRDGTLTFDGLDALTTTRQLTSQVTLSHDTAPMYLLDTLHREGVGEGFRNLVRIGGPAVTTAENDATAADEAPVTFQRLDLLMNSDAKASGLADFYADLFATETPFHSAVTVTAAAVSDATYNSEIFPRKIRDRVTVELAPVGGGADLSDQVFIDGIAGTITPARWNISYRFASADAYDNNLASAPSTWGVWGTGLWGTATWTY